MKPNKRTLERLQATIKEATAVERSLNLLTSKYGFELVRYVANRMFETESEKRKLEQKIHDAEQKLAELRDSQKGVNALKKEKGLDASKKKEKKA